MVLGRRKLETLRLFKGLKFTRRLANDDEELPTTYGEGGQD